MSLDNFGVSCGVKEFSKTVYPYEKWVCPNDLRECKTFPPYADFLSSLSKQENEKYLEEFENIVNHRLKVGKWDSIR
jgi:hypothetical protein